MHSGTIRQTFIDYFRRRGHAVIESHSLVPEPGDPLLLTGAGMQPLIPYLRGRPHPDGARLTGSQRCLRTVDIDAVGNASHLTLFEMLGSWSLGDYFKHDALRFALELLCDGFGLDPGRLSVSVFSGSERVAPDRESPRRWLELGMPSERIHSLGPEHNWWSLGGPGPCGPDSEIFHWTGEEAPQGRPDTDDRWLEVWNIVFMEYELLPAGELVELSQRNVDTGLGLERLSTLLQGAGSVYDTDLLSPLIEQVRVRSRHRCQRSERIVADHLRASVMLLADGVQPLGTGRGYVLRRLIRRAVRHGSELGLSEADLLGVGETAVEHLSRSHAHVAQQSEAILWTLSAEQQRFGRALTRGLRALESATRAGRRIDGRVLHHLSETYGLPVEIAVEELQGQKLALDPDWRRQYDDRVREHSERSRA